VKKLQRLVKYTVMMVGLWVLLAVNTATAQNVTGDPWKMLILVYRNIDTDYVDIDGQTKHLTATMPQQEAQNMVQSFLNQPHRGNVYDFSDHLAELEANVLYVDRALTNLEPIANGFWPSPAVTQPELDQYAPDGLYDSVIVFWQASHPTTGQSIPTYGWGLGYWPGDYANGMTYASVFNLNWVWTNDTCEGEVFLHEWLHGVTGFYMSLGFPFPYEDLHGAEEAGYTVDANGCWKPWLRDYMRGLVYENGQPKALVPATWHSGSVTTHDIEGWRAEYYNNDTLTDLPVVVRDDAAIDFQWYEASPHPLLAVDHFSARWTKDVNFGGGHTVFKLFRDDGLRVYIDGTRIFNEWSHGLEWDYIDVNVTAGWHTVRVEYYEDYGWAGATVQWFPLPGTEETEGNNTPGYADQINGSAHGFINPAGDVDYFWFSGQAGQQLTAEVTAARNGSDLDSYLTLYAPDGTTVLATNDDYNGADSTITHTLPQNGMYYLAVRHYNNSGGPSHWYNLSVTLSQGGPNTFFLSPSGNATLGGIAAQGADILRYTKNNNTWTMVYDGSVRGTTKNISAFSLMDDGSLLLVFAANQVIPSLGTAKPQDVVRFTPSAPGIFPLGTGTYSWHFQGANRGLTTSGEKIDAVDQVGSRLLLSISGAGSITRPSGGVLKLADEDVFVFDRSATQWENDLLIDGSKITGMGVEDISGLWDDPQSGNYYVTILGPFNLSGVAGNDKSIVKLTPNGGATVYTPTLVDWLAAGATFPGKLDGLDVAP
jgi:hypothetical protein